jgi:tetratricopeptide (TPR) repeat protein
MEMIRLAEEAGDSERSMRGHIDRIADRLELGDMPAVYEGIDIYTRLVEELRQPRYRWNLTILRTMRALLGGRFAEAELLAMQALTLGQQIENPSAVNFFGVQMFSLCREQGRLHELETAVKNFVAQYAAVPGWRAALASLYSDLGRDVEARSEFERLAANDFTDLPRDNSWLIGATLLAETCAFLADSRSAVLLYELLLPYAEHNVVVGDAAACNGSASRPLGLLAATLERWPQAAVHFERALCMNMRIGARPFVARTQYEYAAMLLAWGQPEKHEKARALLDSALATAQELDMRGLEGKIQGLGVRGRVLEGEDKRQSDTTPTPREVPLSSPQSSTPNVFRRDGEHWTLAYRGTVCRLKNAKGLHYLAFLLQHPEQEFLATEMIVIVDGLGMTREPDSRDRGVTSAAERARLNVTKTIKAALKKISENHPVLGYHLTTSVKTGTSCSYTPDPTYQASWIL